MTFSTVSLCRHDAPHDAGLDVTHEDRSPPPTTRCDPHVDAPSPIRQLGVTDLTVSPCVNGVILNREPMYVVNLVARFGYEVIASSGGQECMWTMKRTIDM